MSTLTHGYKGMRVLMTLNWDRLFFAAALFAALKAGSYFALLGVN